MVDGYNEVPDGFQMALAKDVINSDYLSSIGDNI